MVMETLLNVNSSNVPLCVKTLGEMNSVQVTDMSTVLSNNTVPLNTVMVTENHGPVKISSMSL